MSNLTAVVSRPTFPSKTTISILLILSAAFASACHRSGKPQETLTVSHQQAPPAPPVPTSAPEPTAVEMRNVILREAGGISLRVRSLRGRMYATRPGEVPSFDDLSSFLVEIDAAVIRANLTELARLVNHRALSGSSLQNITIAVRKGKLRIRGTLHKGLAIPVEITAEPGVSPDGKIELHASRLRVLKMPVGPLLKTLHIKMDDLVHPDPANGLQLVGDTLYIDQEKLLSQPRKRGKVVSVQVSGAGEIIERYGSTNTEAAAPTGTWRNFISLQGGTFDFGRLTMHRVALMMIDTANDDWFDFDVSHYQEQLVNGYTRLTPEAALQVFMPDMSRVPHTATNQAIPERWMKNRYVPQATISR